MFFILDYDSMCSEMDFTPEKSFSSNYKNSLTVKYLFFYDFPKDNGKNDFSYPENYPFLRCEFFLNAFTFDFDGEDSLLCLDHIATSSPGFPSQ